MSTFASKFDIEDAREQWQAVKILEYSLNYMKTRAGAADALRSKFFESLLGKGNALRRLVGPKQYLATAVGMVRTLSTKGEIKALLAVARETQERIQSTVAHGAISKDRASFEKYMEAFPHYEDFFRRTFSPPAAYDTERLPGSSSPFPATLTAIEVHFLRAMRALARKSCLVILIHLHGVIEAHVPPIRAPEGMCVTLIRSAITGCVATGGTPFEVGVLERNIADRLPPSVLTKEADREARARSTQFASDAVYELQEKLINDRVWSPRFQKAIERYRRELQTPRSEPGHHCSAVECVPDQLFFNKLYGKSLKEGKEVEYSVQILHMDADVDLLAIMLKCGFGSINAESGTHTIYRDELFLFFNSMGVKDLTVVDQSCSSIVFPRSGEGSLAEIRTFKQIYKGVLGGNADRYR